MDPYSSSARKPTVLIVDDDRSAAGLIKMMLRTRGYDVVVVYSGQQAIDLLDEVARTSSRWHPMPLDVILLDIMMPGANGFKVCQRVKEDPLLKYIPVVMVTALDSVSDKVAAVAFGADGYVTKPFLPEELSVATKAKVQIKRREEALLRRNQELEAINGVAAAAASTLDPNRVMTESLAALMAHTDASAAAIYALDEEGNGLRLGAQHGVSRPTVLPLEQAYTPSPMLQSELDPDAGRRFASLGDAGLKAFIGVPLRGIERLLGVLEVYHQRADGFGKRDLDMFSEIGNCIGVALQNAQIFQRTQALLLKSTALATGTNP